MHGTSASLAVSHRMIARSLELELISHPLTFDLPSHSCAEVQQAVRGVSLPKWLTSYQKYFLRVFNFVVAFVIFSTSQSKMMQRSSCNVSGYWKLFALFYHCHTCRNRSSAVCLNNDSIMDLVVFNGMHFTFYLHLIIEQISCPTYSLICCHKSTCLILFTIGIQEFLLSHEFFCQTILMWSLRKITFCSVNGHTFLPINKLVFSIMTCLLLFLVVRLKNQYNWT